MEFRTSSDCGNRLMEKPGYDLITTNLENVSMNPSETPPLGNFSKLPPEVRSMIWRFLMPEDCENVDIPSESWEVGLWSLDIDKTKDVPASLNTLGILRTNHAVYDEFSEDLYRRMLCFSFHPGTDRWIVKRTKAKPEHFLHTNFSRFRKIRIEIYAPGKGDPGQLLLLEDQVIDLICALEGVKYVLDPDCPAAQTFYALSALGKQYLRDRPQKDIPELSNVELVFLDHGSFSWFDGDTPRTTFKNVDQFDLESILNLFQYLRNVRCARVILPSQADGNCYLDRCATNAEASMQSLDKFGIHEYDWDTEEAQLKLLIFLDMALDALPGLTAAKLRLTRFQFI